MAGQWEEITAGGVSENAPKKLVNLTGSCCCNKTIFSECEKMVLRFERRATFKI